MKLDLVSSNYEVYLGPNVSSVVGLAKLSESEWFYSRMPWRSKEFKVCHVVPLEMIVNNVLFSR